MNTEGDEQEIRDLRTLDCEVLAACSIRVSWTQKIGLEAAGLLDTGLGGLPDFSAGAQRCREEETMKRSSPVHSSG